MRVFLFILLAILIASCSTTKEHDCDYSDYKTISLEDFEWVKEVQNEGIIIIEDDSVFYSFPDLWLEKPTRRSKIFKIDALNGDFIDSIFTKEFAVYYASKYPYDKVPCGDKYFIKDPSDSCTFQVNILFGSPFFYHSSLEKRSIAIEIFDLYMALQSEFEKYKFKLDIGEIRRIVDFALYKGCYLISVFDVDLGHLRGSNMRIGLLDLKKLIYNY